MGKSDQGCGMFYTIEMFWLLPSNNCFITSNNFLKEHKRFGQRALSILLQETRCYGSIHFGVDCECGG